MNAAQEGVRRVETVGAVCRGKYGQLCRIVSVREDTRTSENHIVAPLDVVVITEPVGSPGYGHSAAWASSLTLAEPGDRYGAHAHRVGCECGEPFDVSHRSAHFGWYDMRPSWERNS